MHNDINMKLPIILENFREHIFFEIKKNWKRSQHVTSWTWKHKDFDRLCPNFPRFTHWAICNYNANRGFLFQFKVYVKVELKLGPR